MFAWHENKERVTLLWGTGYYVRCTWFLESTTLDDGPSLTMPIHTRTVHAKVLHAPGTPGLFLTVSCTEIYDINIVATASTAKCEGEYGQ